MFRQISRTIHTSPQWFIRAYTKTDDKRIQEIALPVIRDLVSAQPGIKPKQALELYQANIQQAIDDPSIKTRIISQQDQTVGGFITYHLSDRCLSKPNGIIEHLAIDPLYQNQKLGTELLNQAVKDLEAQGARAILLRITDPKVAKFYERQGFIVTKDPDFRFGIAGKMVKFIHRSPVPLIGPTIDRIGCLEKQTIITKLVFAIAMITLLHLTDGRTSKKRSKD